MCAPHLRNPLIAPCTKAAGAGAMTEAQRHHFQLATPALDHAGAVYREHALREIANVHDLSGTVLETLLRQPLDLPALTSIGWAMDTAFKNFGAAMMGLGASISSEGSA